jgi:hypothetical protein
MKNFIRNTVKKVMRKLFGSMIHELIDEGSGVVTTVHNIVEQLLESSDHLSWGDLDDFVRDDSYDFDEFVTKRDFDPSDYITQTDLDDQLDGFDPDDFVQRGDFDPDDFVRCDDCDPDDFVQRGDFDPDDYDFEDFVTKYDLEEALDDIDPSNLSKKDLEILRVLSKAAGRIALACTQEKQQ